MRIIKNICIAKIGPSSYCNYMDVLDNLENRVNELLARLDELNLENARLRNEMTSLSRDMEHLRNNNKDLQTALEKELRLREEALARIDALLYKIREHNPVG